MKKGIVTLLVLLALLSTFAQAYATGGQIPRIQTFPAERTATAKQEAPPVQEKTTATDQLSQTISELQLKIDSLKTQVDQVKTDLGSSETRTQGQVSELSNAISTMKTTVDGLGDLRLLRTEIPPLLEEPREIITPKELIYLSVANIVLLAIILILLFSGRRKKSLEAHSHPELNDYIKQHLKKGIAPTTIRQQLLSHDWDVSDINEAFKEVQA